MIPQLLRRLEVLVESLATVLRSPSAPPPRRLQTAFLDLARCLWQSSDPHAIPLEALAGG